MFLNKQENNQQNTKRSIPAKDISNIFFNIFKKYICINE